MAALTLEAWRDRTLEQVHFAAKAALNAVVVQGHPSLRQCVAATATGDLNQCLAQGFNIDAVRRMAHGMAVRGTAVPGFATTLDPKGVLSLNNLAEAMHRLRGGVGGARSTVATRAVRRLLSSTGRGAVVPMRIHGVATMHEQAQEAGSCQQQLTKTGQLARGKHQVGHALSRPSMT